MGVIVMTVSDRRPSMRLESFVWLFASLNRCYKTERGLITPLIMPVCLYDGMRESSTQFITGLCTRSQWICGADKRVALILALKFTSCANTCAEIYSGRLSP